MPEGSGVAYLAADPLVYTTMADGDDVDDRDGRLKTNKDEWQLLSFLIIKPNVNVKQSTPHSRT